MVGLLTGLWFLIVGSIVWLIVVPLAELFLWWYRRKHNIIVRK